MKKLLIILSLFIFGSFSAVQAGEGKGYLACGGIYALNLGVIGYRTGSIDLVDVGTACFSAVAASDYLIFPPKTEKECKIKMGMQVAAGGLMLGRIWYKLANRPAPMPVAPMRLIMEVEEVYDLGKVKKEKRSFA